MKDPPVFRDPYSYITSVFIFRQERLVDLIDGHCPTTAASIPDSATFKGCKAEKNKDAQFNPALCGVQIPLLLYPRDDGTKTLTRALFHAIDATGLVDLLLHKDTFEKKGESVDLSGLQEFVCNVVTASQSPLVYKLHKCPDCPHVKWLDTTSYTTKGRITCPLTKTDVKGEKGCNARKNNWNVAPDTLIR